MVGKCVVMLAFAASAYAQLPVATIPEADKKGATDSPLLKRYEGSFIVAYEHKSFGELTLPLSKLEPVAGKATQQNNRVHEPRNKKALEGHTRGSPTSFPRTDRRSKSCETTRTTSRAREERSFTNARALNAGGTHRAAAEGAAEA